MTKHEFAENMSFLPIFSLYLELEREMNKLAKNLELIPKEQRSKYAHAIYNQRVKCKDLASRYLWEYANEGIHSTLFNEKFQKLSELTNLRSENLGASIVSGNLMEFEALCEDIRKEFYDAMAAKCADEMQKQHLDACISTSGNVSLWEEMDIENL